jgi:hypothetical protein
MPSYPFFLFMEKGEEYYKSAWAIVKASATSGGQLAVIIISRDARVKREFPFFSYFLIFTKENKRARG